MEPPMLGTSGNDFPAIVKSLCETKRKLVGRAPTSLRTNPTERMTMKLISLLATLSLGATLMTHLALAAPDAATDPRIDPQIRSFLAKINKDDSPFWELPQPRPQQILTGLQEQTVVDTS